MLDDLRNKPTEQRTYDIVGKQDVDSTGSRAWSGYLSTDHLRAAWMPLQESPFAQYYKSALVDSAPLLEGKIQPRYSEGERRSEAGVKNLIASGELDRTTAVILDSGGAHSVAMAVELVKQGYQPIIMFDTLPDPNGINQAHQGLATMLYFAKEVQQLKEQGAFSASSPPVFIMDCHRTDKPFFAGIADNSYSYSNQDLPPAQVLRDFGIVKVVYLGEGDQNGKIDADFQCSDKLSQDLRSVVAEWNAEGVAVKYTGVAPWEKRERISDRERSAENRFDYAAFSFGDFEIRLKNYPKTPSFV